MLVDGSSTSHYGENTQSEEKGVWERS